MGRRESDLVLACRDAVHGPDARLFLECFEERC